ncbi:MAG TPA: hypothetical protein VNZ52_03870 [Candidatus Thermoplasmatota archaeon]|nr:hypothetical protein [Candidatus Thermoplasmatota archaeon]
MPDCSLCGQPLGGDFCSRCYPEHAAPQGLGDRVLVDPALSQAPASEAPAAAPKGAVVGALALLGILLLGTVGLFLLMDEGDVPAAETRTYRVPVGTLDAEVDASQSPPRLEFRTWQPGDRVELTGGVTRTRDSSRGLTLQVDGYDFLIQGARSEEFPLGSQVVLTLTIERRYSPRLAVDIEWFREDLGKDPPADLMLPASAVARLT